MVGDGSSSANMQIPLGGLCIDSDGGCAAPGNGGLSIGSYGLAASNDASYLNMNDPVHMNGNNIRLGGGWLSGDGDNEGIMVGGAGNVGIGTTTPNNQLTVSGSADVTGTLSVGTGQSLGQLTLGNNQWISSVSGDGTSSVNMMKVNTDDQIQFGGGLSIDGGFVLPTDGGRLTLADMQVTDSPASGDPMSYAFKLDAGNMLEIYGEADGTGGLQNQALRASADLAFQQPSNVTTTSGDLTLNPSGNLVVDGSSNVGLGTSSPNNQLTVSGHADVTGSLGVGTSSPAAALDVAGNARLNEKLTFTNSTDQRIHYDTDQDGSGFYFQRATSSGQTTLTLEHPNVGIGTTTPNKVLDVNSGTRNVTARFESTDTHSWIALKDDTTSIHGVLLGAEGGDMKFRSGSSENMRLTSGGNLGIGTTSPNNKLTVSGNADITGNVGIGTATPDASLDSDQVLVRGGKSSGGHNINNSLVLDGPSGEYLTAGRISGLFGSPSREGYVFELHDEGDDGVEGGIRFQNRDQNSNVDHKWLTMRRNDTYFYPDQNGTVGIGTTNPTQSLSVAGTIQSGSLNQSRDYLADADGSTTTGTGTAESISENAALEPVASGDGICTDSLTNPTDIFTDSGADCDVDDADTHTVLLGSLPAGDGTTSADASAVTNEWAYLDNGATANSYDDGEDLYIDSFPKTQYTSGQLLTTGDATNLNQPIDAKGSGDLLLQTGSTGSVGIGTTSPGYALDIAGDMRVKGDDIQFGAGESLSAGTNLDIKSDGGYLDFKTGSSTYGYVFRQNGDNTDWANLEVANSYVGLASNNNDPANHLTVTDNGNVGVGTSTPNNQLTVSGNADISGFLDMRGQGGIQGTNYTDFINKELGNYDINGRLYWDLSAGLYIKSGNAPNPQTGGSLLWSSENFTAGNNVSVSYNGEDHPTLSVGDVETLSSSLTSGSVVFSDGSSLSQDNANFFWDDTNDRLGLGTSSPNAALDVRGRANIRNSLQLNGAATTYHNLATRDTNGNPETGTMKVDMPKSWSNTMMQIRVHGYNYTSDTGAWEVVIGGYNYSGGPSWERVSAEIRGRAPFSKVRLAHDGDTNVLLLGDTNTDWRYPKIAVEEFVAGHSSQSGWGSGWSIDRLTDESNISSAKNVGLDTYIDRNGYFGIDTTSPVAPLEVAAGGGSNGTLAVGRTSGDPSIKASSDGSGHLIMDSRAAYVSLNHYTSDDVILANGGGSVGVGTQSPDYDLHVEDTAKIGGSGSGDLVLHDSSNTRTIHLDANSRSYFNGGDLGIGTTSPGGQLTVSASSAASSYNNGNGVVLELDRTNETLLQGNGSTAPYRINLQDGHGRISKLWNAYDSGTGHSYDVGSEGANWLLTSEGSYQFRTAPGGTAGNAISWNLGLVQDNGGSVGIGDTTPANKLTVSGSANVTGSLGVGTSSPDKALHVEHTAKIGGSGAGDLVLHNGVNTRNIHLNATGQSYLKNGELGIDTTNPQTDLDVRGGGLVRSDSSTALQVQNAAGSTDLLTVDAANTQVRIGEPASASLSGARLVVTKAEIQTTLRVGNGTDNVELSPSNGLQFSGSARPTEKITLVPEYEGMTLTPDGTDNQGTLTSDFCSESGRLGINTTICDSAGDEHNYFSWTTSQGSAQDYDIYIRKQLPSDFDVLASTTTVKMYGWRTSSSETVELAIFQADGSQCGSTTNVATSNGSWTQTALDSTGCSFNANDEITIRVRLTATTDNYARAGEISFQYRSKF
ncbi:hypothetical protein BRC19_00335 [Candidatus Saccharibacteria bacterium QS_5_54_17]|nr:MAG: hypothetical protein BRC19_00335 [Candidatus Saccharibacteria bacterium QS_5_54_17]